MQDSKLIVYNTLSRKEEEFVPMHGKEVKMFVCGQTVYDDAHLGHAKNYIDFDVVARWLRHEGYKLTYVQNITDVDDKIIARAEKSDLDPKELAAKYEKRFMEDMEAIGVRKSVDKYPRSHDYIEYMRKQMQLLLDKKYAYISGGDVYFEVDKFKDYTKLSRMKIEELSKHRVEIGEGKRSHYDFALWKAAKPGEPFWDIKVIDGGRETGLRGRPGWHLEDTAMTYAIFGEQYDLHGGASELIFPHHTNEIAQAEAAFGKVPFVKYWMHCGVLSIKGEKMSKSLRNFITIRETLKSYDPEVIRLMVLSTHYRKEIAYSERLMKDAQSRLNYLYSTLGVFYNMKDGESEDGLPEIQRDLVRDFPKAMNNDFDTPLALSALYGAVSEIRKFTDKNEDVEKKTREELLKKILEFANALGILEHDWYKKKIPKEALDMIKERDALRASKNFKEADEIREKVKRDYGITVEDTEYGTIWYFSAK